MSTYFARLRENWESFRYLPDEFRDLPDLVVVLGRLEGRGRGSGVPVDSPVGSVWDFRGDKISRLRAYLDHDEALRVAGLAQ